MIPSPVPPFRRKMVPAAKLYVSHSSAYAIVALSAVTRTFIASPARYQVRSVSILTAKVFMASTVAAISDNNLLFIFIVFIIFFYWPKIGSFDICSFVSDIEHAFSCPRRSQLAAGYPSVVFPYTEVLAFVDHL